MKPFSSHALSPERVQLSRTDPISHDFEPVDGGTGRACRGATATDNNPGNYDVIQGTDDATAVYLFNTNHFFAIYIVRASLLGPSAFAERGFSSWRLPSSMCSGKALRDHSIYSNIENDCVNLQLQLFCLFNFVHVDRVEAPSCVGIEFSAGRCEVWTRTDGIQATIVAWLETSMHR